MSILLFKPKNHLFFIIFGIKNDKTPQRIKTAPDKTNIELQFLSSRNPAIFPPTREPEMK